MPRPLFSSFLDMRCTIFLCGRPTNQGTRASPQNGPALNGNGISAASLPVACPRRAWLRLTSPGKDRAGGTNRPPAGAPSGIAPSAGFIAGGANIGCHGGIGRIVRGCSPYHYWKVLSRVGGAVGGVYGRQLRTSCTVCTVLQVWRQYSKYHVHARTTEPRHLTSFKEYGIAGCLSFGYYVYYIIYPV